MAHLLILALVLSYTSLVSATNWTPSGSSKLVSSPPVYPSPPIHGGTTWIAAQDKARAFLADWSVGEKVNLTYGLGEDYRCTGNVQANLARGFAGLCLNDGPLGIRGADLSSAFPAGLNIAATFDRSLMRRRAEAIAEEFRGKGAHVLLGPMMNLLRVPCAGRNFEGFGADPFLAGENSYEFIVGAQSRGVQTVAKHLLLYEQETDRNVMSANADDRTTHELYLHPFIRAIQADVVGVMTSYNRVNNSWASQNSKLINGLLKTDLDFQGYVVSDWDGTHAGVAAALAGQDMEMGGGSYFGSGQLFDSVNNGSVSKARADDMSVRIISAYLKMNQDKDYPPVNYDVNADDDATNKHVNVQRNHAALIREIGAASNVLLKNKAASLPLRKNLQSIAIIGSDAGSSPFGPDRQPESYDDETGNLGVLATGAGSGSHGFPYLVTPLEAIEATISSRTTLKSSLDPYDLRGAISAATGAQAALVFINEDAGEGLDRYNLTSWRGGEALVKAVAAVNRNTIVVIHASGLMLVEDWIEHENVTAVIYAGLPGQEAGNALVDVLFGDVSPSGRLPFTLAKSRSDYPADTFESVAPLIEQVDYDERLLIDYRHFAAKNIVPRFPFGFGLSYTSFQYADLSIDGEPAAREPFHPVPKVGRLLEKWLHAPRWTVNFVIRNTGPVTGSEIPQLYLSYPAAAGEPPRVLRNFDRIYLAKGESKTVTMRLSLYDLSIWDVVSQSYVVPKGKFTVLIAQDSLSKPVLTGTIG